MSGWTNDFVSFNLGTILITWGFVGFDAVVHISEETRKARAAVPRALFWYAEPLEQADEIGRVTRVVPTLPYRRLLTVLLIRAIGPSA